MGPPPPFLGDARDLQQQQQQQQQQQHGPGGPGQPPLAPPPASIGEAEFEEVMGRNRTVSSSAIARAVADASTGTLRRSFDSVVSAECSNFGLGSRGVQLIQCLTDKFQWVFQHFHAPTSPGT